MQIDVHLHGEHVVEGAVVVDAVADDQPGVLGDRVAGPEAEATQEAVAANIVGSAPPPVSEFPVVAQPKLVLASAEGAAGAGGTPDCEPAAACVSARVEA